MGWAWWFGFWIGKPGIYWFREGKGRGGESEVCQGQSFISQSLLFWVTVRPKLTVTIDTNVNSTILNLEDNVQSWKPGDILVIASTDYSMYQAEEFQVLPCKACASKQVKVAGRTFPHPSLGLMKLKTVRLKVDWNQNKFVSVSYCHNNAAWQKKILKISWQAFISYSCIYRQSRVQLLHTKLGSRLRVGFRSAPCESHSSQDVLFSQGRSGPKHGRTLKALRSELAPFDTHLPLTKTDHMVQLNMNGELCFSH